MPTMRSGAPVAQCRVFMAPHGTATHAISPTVGFSITTLPAPACLGLMGAGHPSGGAYCSFGRCSGQGLASGEPSAGPGGCSSSSVSLPLPHGAVLQRSPCPHWTAPSRHSPRAHPCHGYAGAGGAEQG